MNRVKSGLYWAILATEASHVFCCVLPTIASVTGLLVSMGLIGTMPGFIETLHGAIHAYEVPIIAFAGIVLLAGWVFQFLSTRIDCHNTGCAHGACAPRKKSSLRILWIATALFTFNISVYLFVHVNALPSVAVHEHDHVNE